MEFYHSDTNRFFTDDRHRLGLGLLSPKTEFRYRTAKLLVPTTLKVVVSPQPGPEFIFIRREIKETSLSPHCTTADHWRRGSDPLRGDLKGGRCDTPPPYPPSIVSTPPIRAGVGHTPGCNGPADGFEGTVSCGCGCGGGTIVVQLTGFFRGGINLGLDLRLRGRGGRRH